MLEGKRWAGIVAIDWSLDDENRLIWVKELKSGSWEFIFVGEQGNWFRWQAKRIRKVPEATRIQN